jgi:hypothetical protein
MNETEKERAAYQAEKESAWPDDIREAHDRATELRARAIDLEEAHRGEDATSPGATAAQIADFEATCAEDERDEKEANWFTAMDPPDRDATPRLRDAWEFHHQQLRLDREQQAREVGYLDYNSEIGPEIYQRLQRRETEREA